MREREPRVEAAARLMWEQAFPTRTYQWEAAQARTRDSWRRRAHSVLRAADEAAHPAHPSPEYVWENDWPRVTQERYEIGRDNSDGIVSRPKFSGWHYYFQFDVHAPRTEITHEEYLRTLAAWKVKREAVAPAVQRPSGPPVS